MADKNINGSLNVTGLINGGNTICRSVGFLNNLQNYDETFLNNFISAYTDNSAQIETGCRAIVCTDDDDYNYAILNNSTDVVKKISIGNSSTQYVSTTITFYLSPIYPNYELISNDLYVDEFDDIQGPTYSRNHKQYIGDEGSSFHVSDIIIESVSIANNLVTADIKIKFNQSLGALTTYNLYLIIEFGGIMIRYLKRRLDIDCVLNEQKYIAIPDVSISFSSNNRTKAVSYEFTIPASDAASINNVYGLSFSVTDYSNMSASFNPSSSNFQFRVTDGPYAYYYSDGSIKIKADVEFSCSSSSIMSGTGKVYGNLNVKYIGTPMYKTIFFYFGDDAYFGNNARTPIIENIPIVYYTYAHI